MPTASNTTSDLARRPASLAILPIGATEQHSAHLPLATDTLIIEAVARRTAEKLNAYCLPALPFSISHMHRGSRGTVWLRNSTLAAVVRDLAASLRHEGFSRLAILNGHGGNFILLPVVQDLNLDFPDFLALTVDAWEPIASSGIFEGLAPLLHADEFETSCLLHLLPEAVRRKHIRDQTVEPDRELLRYLPFRQFARRTHAGHPSRASAEKGRRAIECMVEHAVKRIAETLRKVGRHRRRK